MKLWRFITSLRFLKQISRKIPFLKFLRMCTMKFVLNNVKSQTVCQPLKIEASTQRCSGKKVFWKSEHFLVRLVKMGSIARVCKELYLDFVQFVRVFKSFQNAYFPINKVHQIRNNCNPLCRNSWSSKEQFLFDSF